MLTTAHSIHVNAHNNSIVMYYFIPFAVTPPGWWHSHHNTSTEDAWVLPLQDAGLYTYQRTLDIR